MRERMEESFLWVRGSSQGLSPVGSPRGDNPWDATGVLTPASRVPPPHHTYSCTSRALPSLNRTGTTSSTLPPDLRTCPAPPCTRTFHVPSTRYQPSGS